MTHSDLTPAPDPESHPAPPLSAARERIIARLGECFARDELTLDEYERRVTLAYEAPTTEALESIAADLPAPTMAVAPVASAPGQVTALLSSVVRGGTGVVPRQLNIRSWLGNVEMDLSSSTFAAGVTEIRLDVVLGNVEIDLPHHVRVDDASSTILASFENRRGRPGAAVAEVDNGPGVTIRFTGTVVLGSVEVRAR